MSYNFLTVGSDCSPAYTLRNLNLREYALPFDWNVSYSEYHDIVLEKYSRRIERFRQIMKDTKPIVVLCRYRTYDVLQIQKFFAQYYNKTNVYFVNSCPQSYETDKIKNVFTERNQQWNEAALWKEGIDAIIKKIEF